MIFQSFFLFPYIWQTVTCTEKSNFFHSAFWPYLLQKRIVSKLESVKQPAIVNLTCNESRLIISHFHQKLMFLSFLTLYIILCNISYWESAFWNPKKSVILHYLIHNIISLANTIIHYTIHHINEWSPIGVESAAVVRLWRRLAGNDAGLSCLGYSWYMKTWDDGIITFIWLYMYNIIYSQESCTHIITGGKVAIIGEAE